MDMTNSPKQKNSARLNADPPCLMNTYWISFLSEAMEKRIVFTDEAWGASPMDLVLYGETL
jgi:hypothetical protein